MSDFGAISLYGKIKDCHKTFVFVSTATKNLLFCAIKRESDERAQEINEIILST